MGLKRDSVLNSLSFYYVKNNVALDIMHEIVLVLNALIKQKLFSLDKLNYRVTSFDYSFCGRVKKPSLMSKVELKNFDGAMRQSAAQMSCLLRLFTIMIGDLILEENKEEELLLILLLCIFSLHP